MELKAEFKSPGRRVVEKLSPSFWKGLRAMVLPLVFLLLTLDPCPAQQPAKEKFPNRPITVIINFGAGGQADIAVRILAKVAEKKLGVPLVIVNKPGGGGSIGLAELSRAKPDGYTIGNMTIAAATVLPSMQAVAYHPFKDFDYICGFGRFIYGIYSKTDSPLHSIKEVVEAARKNPRKVTYGTLSAGIAIGLKYVEVKENVRMTFIPLQSGQEVANALIGGHTNLALGTPDSVFQFIENKEVRVLAMVTGERFSAFPNAPTLKELGYDIDLTGWNAMGAPAGVPKERLSVIYEAFKEASQDPQAKATLEKLWLSAPYMTGNEVKKIYQQRYTEWKPLVEAMKAEISKK